MSGWNDYGFSSSAFSTQLMDFSKEEIDKFLSEGHARNKQKKSQLKKSASYLSMENLDIQETNAEDDDSEGDDERPSKNKSPPSKAEATASRDHEGLSVEPTYILDQAFKRLTAVGSSTALIGIRNQKSISIANLGDSGFILIRFRNGEPYAAKRSTDQQHSFNIPYQLSILPGERELENLKKAGRVNELNKLRSVLKPPKGAGDMC